MLRILTVGRVDAMKGTCVLLQALARLAQRGLHPTLTVVGDGAQQREGDRDGATASASDGSGAVGRARSARTGSATTTPTATSSACLASPRGFRSS